MPQFPCAPARAGLPEGKEVGLRGRGPLQGHLCSQPTPFRTRYASSCASGRLSSWDAFSVRPVQGEAALESSFGPTAGVGSKTPRMVGPTDVSPSPSSPVWCVAVKGRWHGMVFVLAGGLYPNKTCSPGAVLMPCSGGQRTIREGRACHILMWCRLRPVLLEWQTIRGAAASLRTDVEKATRREP